MPTESEAASRQPLTAKVTAALLGFSRSHVYRHAEALGGYRLGRSLRFDPDVVDLIRRRRRSPEKGAPAHETAPTSGFSASRGHSPEGPRT